MNKNLKQFIVDIKKLNLNLQPIKNKSILKFKCLKEKCPNNCCTFGLPVVITSKDNQNLISQTIFFGGKQLKIVKQNKNGCIYFKNGKCIIYKQRPLACKIYPFYLSPGGKIFYDKNCPGIDHGGIVDIKKIKKIIQQEQVIYNKLNLSKKEKEIFSKLLFKE